MPHSALRVCGVGVNPTRTGVLDIFQAMGAALHIENAREVGGEPVGDVVVHASRLRGTRIDGELVVRAIDEFPIIAVAAACAEGMTVIRGAQELRVKESDRLQMLAGALHALGVGVTELPDGLVIKGRAGSAQPFRAARVSSGGDHRIAMALSVAGLRAAGPLALDQASCVDISFPGFYRVLQELGGVDIRASGKAMKKDLIIALDGPAGAGKSSASRLLAERLGYRYVDTGALYRAVGLLVWEQGLDPEDATALASVCETLDVRFEPGSGGQRLFVGQRDVTEQIRRPEVSQMASRVSAQPLVRARLLTVQRELGRGGGVVVEGRDIGTVVFPEADLKVYLDASAEERSRRRHQELRHTAARLLWR